MPKKNIEYLKNQYTVSIANIISIYIYNLPW